MEEIVKSVIAWIIACDVVTMTAVPPMKLIMRCFYPYRKKQRDAFRLRTGHDIATQT